MDVISGDIDAAPGDGGPPADGVGGPPYRDPARSVEERTADLLGRMSLSEKVAQLGSVWTFNLTDGDRLDDSKAHGRLRDGIGQVSRVAGATNLPPERVAELGNAIQRFLIERTRLGIPAMIHEESLHGVMARGATCFAQSIGQAASWDPALVEEVATMIGRHLHATGASQALAPVLDITRDPRWGRLEETYGEDPYLVAALGCAYVRGIQRTGDGRRSVIATAKHMVGHGLPEGGLNQAPAHIGARELHDAFLLPFEAAVRDAGIGSVMHAYDDLDGVPCVASRELLTTILRDRWGFDGLVVADYMGVEQLVIRHQLTDDLSEAAAMALGAGMDVELPETAAYGAPLRAAIEDGRVAAPVLDRAVARVLRTKLRLGLFEDPYADVAAAARVGARPGVTDEADVALRMARRSIVLLENDGTLPLRPDLRSLAVIGPNADSARALVGDYGHLVHIETLLERRGREGVAGVVAPLDLQLADELASWPTVLSAIRERVGAGTEIRFAPGCGIRDGDDEGIAAAVGAARGADAAILVLGERSGLTSESTSGETRDRMELGLLGRQGELVDAVAATGTPVVIVLVSGRPVAMPREAALASAVLHAWVPGEAGPWAIAEVLFGDVSPGGKLPVTTPRHVGQVPVYYAHRPTGGASEWHRDYVDGSHLPLWPFGHGLSYTRFELGALEVAGSPAPTDGEVVVGVDLANVGERDADEVVQLYVRDAAASVTRPVKELRGFARVTVAAGQRRRITFRLAIEQLAFTGVDGRLVIEPGRHVLMVGTSAADLPLRAEIEVRGEPRVLPARSRFFSRVEVR
jgi:beta-glucosidase